MRTGNGLAWGDAAAMVELTEQIALRKGIGDVLAEGPARVAAHFGHPEIAMAVKGQAIPAYDPRGLKGMGIGYATSNRGACHLRGYTPGAEMGLASDGCGSPGVEGQGGAAEDLPGSPRLLRQPGSVQVQRLRRRRGAIRRTVRNGHGDPLHGGRGDEDGRAGLQPRALLQQPGGIPRGLGHAAGAIPDRSPRRWAAPRGRYANSTRCWRSTTSCAVGRTAWFPSRSCASWGSSSAPTRRVGGRRKAIRRIAQPGGRPSQGAPQGNSEN